MADLLKFIGFKTVSLRRKNSSSFYQIPFTIYLLAFAVCLLTSVNLQAQEDEIPTNIAPPPVKVISKEEKNALAGSSDVKDRTKLAIDLMEARLKKAESLNTTESYNDLLNELGSFNALMDDALKFLNRNDDGRGKVMNTFKKFEMALRTFMPRIELIRRDLPDNFEYHVRKLLKTVRDARSKAVEPFYTSTVLPDKGN